MAISIKGPRNMELKVKTGGHSEIFNFKQK